MKDEFLDDTIHWIRWVVNNKFAGVMGLCRNLDPQGETRVER